MGKGSAPRPFSVANEEYASRWDAIFGKIKEKPTSCPACGSTDYESVKIQPPQSDPIRTYCLCNKCGEEFYGKTIWD
jgi:formylmethanofuran dehydrogenase subunit E